MGKAEFSHGSRTNKYIQFIVSEHIYTVLITKFFEWRFLPGVAGAGVVVLLVIFFV